MGFESERTEFKSTFTEGIYKEVVAFANAGGGEIYVGADNEGRTVGLADAGEVYTRITNGIRDAISPDVTMFVKYAMLEDDVVKITVGEGAHKPYYLKVKGLKPSGVYVRQGASAAPASPEQIRQMIKASDGDVYEEMRSLSQDLTFSAATETFRRCGVAFSAEKHIALGVVNPEDKLFTNLGLLLSDECEHTVKIAVFADSANTAFKDSKEFSGSVLKQLEQAFDYLMLCNRTVSEIRGLERVEKADYPEGAVREALLNALVHRDYGFSGSTIVNVNDEQMEFISIGGLLPGLCEEDIVNGISQPRNKRLAEVFHRLHFIESYGTGIRKIYHLYESCEEKPRMEVTAHTFKMILPNRNVVGQNALAEHMESPVTPQMQKVLDFLEVHERMTDAQVQELLGVRRTRSYTLMRKMTEMGLVSAVGRGAGKYFSLRD